MLPSQAIRTVIIDDEQSAIKLLEQMLAKIEGVTVAGSEQDIKEGISLILRFRPDIVFLDIKLRDENGFDLIQRLKDYDVNPFIVMVTGYDQFGMEALKAGAFDYLLKPVDPKELLKVVSRCKQKQIQHAQVVPFNKIRFNTLGGFILIDPEEILYCKAEANYTDISLTNQIKHTISLNIGSIEKMLPSATFFRISRSIIINVKFLSEINRRKRLCVITAGQVSASLTIASKTIKDLEGFLVH